MSIDRTIRKFGSIFAFLCLGWIQIRSIGLSTRWRGIVILSLLEFFILKVNGPTQCRLSGWTVRRVNGKAIKFDMDLEGGGVYSLVSIHPLAQMFWPYALTLTRTHTLTKVYTYTSVTTYCDDLNVNNDEELSLLLNERASRFWPYKLFKTHFEYVKDRENTWCDVV